MKRAARFGSLLVATVLGVFLGAVVLFGALSPDLTAPKPASIPSDRPTLVLVRGWLWDPSSRSSSGQLEMFPGTVESILSSDYGLEPEFLTYEWSRIPKDVFKASRQFGDFAANLSQSVDSECLGFIGHSAGAAIVYRAAASGVPMGFMGTLGLPTFGSAKPAGVGVWANFYTDTHVDDIAGWGWGEQMAADVNINLKMPHREFWGAPEVAQVTADSIAKVWQSCD